MVRAFELKRSLQNPKNKKHQQNNEPVAVNPPLFYNLLANLLNIVRALCINLSFTKAFGLDIQDDRFPDLTPT